MKAYRVEWCIDVDADSPRDAAAQALAIQRDPDSIATVFVVYDKANQCGSGELVDLNPEAAA